MIFQNQFCYAYDPGRWLSHERIILSSRDCPGFLPMKFIEEPSRLLAFYECSGYVPLENYCIEQAADVLFLLEKTLLILQGAADQLILPERITLNRRTVFYRSRDEDVRIAFCPARDRNPSAGTVSFLRQLGNDVPEAHRLEILRLARSFEAGHLNAEDMLTLTGLARRRAGRQTISSS